MKSKVFFGLLLFLSGFLIHAFFFPDFLSNGNFIMPSFSAPTTDKNGTLIPTPDPMFITVVFDGQHFSRHNLTMKKSYYLVIKNVSKDTLMWLSSPTPQLNTKRGYAYTEALQMTMNDTGKFLIEDQHNQHEQLVVTVK